MNITPRPDNSRVEGPFEDATIDHRSRVILDSSLMKIADRPALLQEKLLKTQGVLSVEINAFSGRVAVEFDSTLVSLDMIRKLISSKTD